jgi:hypothetical protein
MMSRTSLTLTTLAAALAATLAFAAPGGGYGPGPGAVQGADCPQQQPCGMGYGPGGGGGPGQGYGKGLGRGGGGAGAYGMMTEEERAEHRQKMHSFNTVGECKAYFDEHRAQMAARAKERGIEPGPGPRVNPCDRMERRGLLKPAA